MEAFTKQFLHHKRLICRWEEIFAKTNDRKPGKDDMKNAPDAVKFAYKEYRRMKEEEPSIRKIQVEKIPQMVFSSLGIPKNKLKATKVLPKTKLSVSFKAKSFNKPLTFKEKDKQALAAASSIRLRGSLINREKKKDSVGISIELSLPQCQTNLNAKDEKRKSMDESEILNEIAQCKALAKDAESDDELETVPLFVHPRTSKSISTSHLLSDENSILCNSKLKSINTGWLDRARESLLKNLESIENVEKNFDTKSELSDSIQKCTDSQIKSAFPFCEDNEGLEEDQLNITIANAEDSFNISESDTSREESFNEGCTSADVSMTEVMPDSTIFDLKEVEEFVQPAKRPYSALFSSPEKKEVKKRKFFTEGARTRLERIKKLKENAYASSAHVVEPEFQTKKKKSLLKAVLSKTVKTSSPTTDAHAKKVGKRTTRAATKKSDSKSSTSKSKAVTQKRNKLASAKKSVKTAKKVLTSNVDGPKKNTVIDIFDEKPEDNEALDKIPTKRGKGRRTKAARGKNDNFVRIDIGKRVFVRGRKHFSLGKNKRQEWKNRKAEQAVENKLKNLECKKCGEFGHFAKFCPKKYETSASDAVDTVISPFPSLEEAAALARSKEDPTIQNSNQWELLSSEEYKKAIPSVFTSETTEQEEDELMNSYIAEFGYESFRTGQKEAIRNILHGESTLVILSTGSGKSLIYQLPAYAYSQKYPGSLALVVSPLVSLMDDQVKGIPDFLPAGCIHSGMSEKSKSEVLDSVRKKKLSILLVSPEAVCGGFFGLFKDPAAFPAISFVCIDEVHCVSQWSHNFRPCYLQLCKILREKLGVERFVGLTATATLSTSLNVSQLLNVEPSKIIRGETLPENLNLSVSRDMVRDEALLCLLQGPRFSSLNSIIIYCTRREETERISTLIRTHLNDPFGTYGGLVDKKSRTKISTNCEAYHAGLSAHRRRTVQKEFMAGRIRVVVATVAFGMGIDKSDIRSVIHYNMPKTFESYVQEIGRAGRDGIPAECHLFIDNAKNKNLAELRRHVFANSVDRPTLRKLVKRLFRSCKCTRTEDTRCSGHEVSFSVEASVLELDLPQENIQTLLCYLELGDKKWITQLPLTYRICRVQSYCGPQALSIAANTCPVLGAGLAIAKKNKKFKEGDVHAEFDIVEAASAIGCNSVVAKKELQSLEWNGGVGGSWRRTGILIEFSDLSFRVLAPGDLNDSELDAILNSLQARTVEQEKSQLLQLNRVYQALYTVSTSNARAPSEDCDKEKSLALKNFIADYFNQSQNEYCQELKQPLIEVESDVEDRIRSDVQSFLSDHSDIEWTGRAIARIFQGIPSPNFPSDVWWRKRDYWRIHLETDFNHIVLIATKEILGIS